MLKIHGPTDCKVLRPGCDGLAVAMGQRLVQFFGGRLIDNDNVDTPAVYRRGPLRATMPPRKFKQTSNDLWYQFENALRNLTPLRAHELRDGMRRSRYTLSCPGFLTHLEALKTAEAMQASVPDSERPAVRGPRL